MFRRGGFDEERDPLSPELLHQAQTPAAASIGSMHLRVSDRATTDRTIDGSVPALRLVTSTSVVSDCGKKPASDKAGLTWRLLFTKVGPAFAGPLQFWSSAALRRDPFGFPLSCVAELPRGKSSAGVNWLITARFPCDPVCGRTEDRPMTPQRTPYRLQIDLAVIVISVAIVGIVA